MTELRRVRLGAPNEERFGFSQAVAHRGRAGVSGQVGKDNATGAMVSVDDLSLQVRRAVANVCESAAAALPGGVPVALVVHCAVPLAGVEPLVQAQLDHHGVRPAVTGLRVPALSHPEYLLEISATAHATMTLDRTPATHAPWTTPTLVRAGEDLHVAGCHGHGEEVGRALHSALCDAAELLRGSGAALGDVVAEHVYVRGPVGPDGFAALCDAHRLAYADGPPASTLVLVDELPGGATVAVALWARRPS